MPQVTCALALTFEGKLLIARATGGGERGWSLPKGLMDPGEPPREAALRECVEETGLDYRGREPELVDLGRHAYRQGKDYHLFELRLGAPPDVAACRCESTFYSKKAGRDLPEVDAFDFVDAAEAARRLNPEQGKLVLPLLGGSLSPNSPSAGERR